MDDFRKVTPKRRTDVNDVPNYTAYKPLLKEDFHSRCGYCGDHDFFRNTYYEVDHFVPKRCLKTISLTDYSNLVYACRTCNNAKRGQWPTLSETVHNDGKQGFVDPCDKSFASHFERLANGEIHPKTVLGSWMWSALNMGHPSHRLIWNLEQLKTCLDNIGDCKGLSEEEMLEINKLNTLYRSLEDSLRGKPDFD